MTHKESCGGCAQCQKVDNPYEDQVQAVWHDPTGYDVAKHGPPYLKLSSDQKAVVKAHLETPKVKDFLQKQSAVLASYPTDGEPLRPLSWLLAAMRSLTHIHQTHHWQTHGPHYYADHLLFDRLYTESLPFVDEVAERAVGAGSADLVDARRQMANIHKIIDMCYAAFGEVAEPNQMVLASLMGETLFLGFLKDVIKMLEASDNLSPGTSNLLEGLGDKHEQFTYLLKQRSTVHTAASYSYER